MSNKTPKRSFGFGCRDTPDVFNKFLEQRGYYRKHVATDSSSLFRVVSELRYDIQLYHPKVRAECVKYMRNNRAMFCKDIRHGYDSYVNNMSRPRTYGSLVELRALALLHKANVFLFEPYSEGKWYMYNSMHTVIWRVFIGRDNHFDVVYPLEYMKEAAACQAIVYQIVYEKVLRLPDVEYAVERMLHDPEDKLIKYEKNRAGTTVATTEDGMRMELCRTGRGTNCVLTYSHLCHFHNQTNFHAIERFFMDYGPEAGCRVYISDTYRYGFSKPNPLLRESKISCVRQLLAIGITPFPYKAAKSLDPNIYRNVEYDVWQDVRAERLIEMLGNEKRYREAKYGKRMKPLNPLTLMKKELKIERSIPEQKPNATEPTREETHSVIAVVPYPQQSIYYPPPDQYTLNPVGLTPSEANYVTFADPIGVPTCLCNNYSPSSPLQFHAPTPQLQPAPSPLTQLQQVPSPSVQSNETLAVPDFLSLVPHTLNHQPNEYVMMVDPVYQSPQQPLHSPYLHQASQQQQPQHLPYLQASPQQPLQRDQQQQPIAAPFLPRCLFHYPNGTDSNNRGTITMAYDTNPFAALPPVTGVPGFWRF